MLGSPPWGQTGAKASGRSAARQGGACATLPSRSAAAAVARVGGGLNNPRSDLDISRRRRREGAAGKRRASGGQAHPAIRAPPLGADGSGGERLQRGTARRRVRHLDEPQGSRRRREGGRGIK